ncbi:MAG: hypothetical protein HAW59_02655 [Betaproteobacteria bacterium]|nr:hypothetical protein [Betaproteobacteria bacterium]
MNASSKIIYAQSSDVKSRTYLEYRRDMKKKAIAELEFLPFLEKVLSEKHGASDLSVKKYGGDAELWFAPSGKITQEPDYRAAWNGGKDSFLYEFQYAENTENLDYFDFKVSKVGKKAKGVRAPHRDRKFFYIAKPEKQYAFISPEWIMENGREAPVPAWGSRPAYRVPRNIFMRQLQDGGADIANVINIVDGKNILLNFQHAFLDLEGEKLSRRLQQVVDEEKLLKIVPRNLRGFYEVCFLLNKLNKAPDNPAVWLVYLTSFLDQITAADELAQFMFAFDFLYFKSASLNGNETAAAVGAAIKVRHFISKFPRKSGLFSANPQEPPLEETRRILFAANLLEDLMQDMAVSGAGKINRVERIFQTVKDIPKIVAQIKKSENIFAG